MNKTSLIYHLLLMILLTMAGIASSVAATLMIERTGVDTFDLQAPQKSAVYYFLEDSLDLETFDPSQAVTGTWDQDNSANIRPGVYDPEKWAVVFKYSSVNIPAGVTVTFKNHATRAPVVWLVQGSVNIEGVVSLDGEAVRTGVDGLILAEPGPGGFRGGAFGPAGWGAGLGIGGANYGGVSGGSATHASSYGNPAVLPLIGGSGGGGSTGNGNKTGSGGGGAILIGAATSIHIEGNIRANGGNSTPSSASRGSGGAIKLIAESVTQVRQFRMDDSHA